MNQDLHKMTRILFLITACTKVLPAKDDFLECESEARLKVDRVNGDLNGSAE